jgi:hypothetical protein
MPGGAIALVLASQANGAKGVGDYARAKDKARAAIEISSVSMANTAVLVMLWLLAAILAD